MKQYRLVNNLVGWLTFLVAATTYCLTVEPTASFWDCPEFITTAYKLEVGHPPGAPFFMLTGNFFTLFTDDPSKVAFCVNIMSALLSALCILFLFWTITHLTRKLICKDGIVSELWQTITIMGAGLTGALAYTWSDTFWFSAVEGEVYAYSSMFTALVFWLILKWEDHADEPRSDRWLVLIFYLTGLSIGVHLLNLLCLPAIALVYYFRKNSQARLKGSLGALAVSALLVVAVLYGVVPGIVKVGGCFEQFFVNTLGMSFNTGLVVYILVLIGVVLSAIYYTGGKDRRKIVPLYLLSVALLGIPFLGDGIQAFVVGLLLLCALTAVLLWKKKDGEYVLRKRFLNTSLLCMLMLMIGYSSYAVIVVRSTQNTPMDQNSPEDIFTLGSYLSREQYGQRPLLYGETYLSAPAYSGFKVDGGYLYRQYIPIERTRVQRHVTEDPNAPDQYDTYQETIGYEYAGAAKMIFPRMYSPAHTQAYNAWLGIDPENEDDYDGFFAAFRHADYDLDITGDRYGNDVSTTETVEANMPTQWTNLRFFLSYQVNFMYWRYFLWNFAGRQNDIQGNGELEHGNFLTGFSFIDNALYGDQSKLPDELKTNKGHNVFYCLPLLLGLIGFFWQAFRGERGIQQLWVVLFLFFMTGLAIVLYLNQTPQQPRERDYAYAGSFYAFAIWIGMGVAALVDGVRRLRERFAQKWLPSAVAASVVSLICLLVPLQMVSQTWDDHDRSDRYACRDFGMNYLSTLPDEGAPIIFTNGDNDTFPLWYAQEVEGFRTDTRVCNLSYLGTDWYIDQMRRPAYNSPGLPIAWNRSEYVNNMGHDYFQILDKTYELDEIAATHPNVDPYELEWLIDNYVRKEGYLPTSSFHIKVDKDAVRRSGMLLPFGPDSIPDYMEINLDGKSSLSKSEMMIYEMLARSHWKRPIYMSVTLGQDNMAGLQDYLVLEGLAYRITPFRGSGIQVDVDKMYKNMMTRFRYGNVKADGIYLDETVMRMCQTHRRMFVCLASELLRNFDVDRATKVLEKCKVELPEKNIPYEEDTELVRLWLMCGKADEAERVAASVARQATQYLEWASTLGEEKMRQKGARFLGDCMRQLNILDELQVLPFPEKGAARIQAYVKKAYASEAAKYSMTMFLSRAKSYADEALGYSRAFESGTVGADDMETVINKFYQAYLQLSEVADKLKQSSPDLARQAEQLLKSVEDCWLGRQVNLASQLEGLMPGDEDEAIAPEDSAAAGGSAGTGGDDFAAQP